MTVEKIVVPDFGDVQEITVVEVYIEPGDQVEVDMPVIALESEKAVMDIPSPISGIVEELLIKEEDTVRTGDVIATVECGEGGIVTESVKEEQVEVQVAPVEESSNNVPESPEQESVGVRETIVESDGTVHATPSVRAYARELGVGLERLVATGPKGRILKEDVQKFVKESLSSPLPVQASGMSALSVEPPVLEDFTVYGDITELPLGRIKKISGPHLHRSWISIPHVTHFDETDLTELEAFRKSLNAELTEGDVRYSVLVFIIKAVVAVLKEYPLFNSSLVPGNGSVIAKKYYHIGIAVDTPDGLVVPVIRDCDKKGAREISEELADISSRARKGALKVQELQGGSFTISSLGGIGGTAFTPIINGTQAAILGLSRNSTKPVWDKKKGEFVPKLTLPFSLSYDHRIIDGAEAARFCRTLSVYIEDMKRIVL